MGENTVHSKRLIRKATFLNQVPLVRLREEDVREFLNRHFDAMKKLNEVGIIIGYDFLTILLLYNLPSTFETFRCALERRDKNLTKPEVLKAEI